MPAQLFQKFQLVIGLNGCPFAPPSLEKPSSDWLKKHWSRLDFNPRMNHPHVGEEPECDDSWFVYNGFGSSLIHWLSLEVCVTCLGHFRKRESDSGISSAVH